MAACRVVIFAAAFAASMYGGGETTIPDITVPLEGGSIIVRPNFIRVTKYGVYVPELSFRLKNETPYPWTKIKLQFDIAGFCKGEPQKWTLLATTGVEYAPDHPMVQTYAETVIPLAGNVDGCKPEIIAAHLVLAENSKFKINGETGEVVDLDGQLQELKEKQDAQAEAERKAVADEEKKKAAEAQRRRRLVSERKRKEAEEDARLAKIKEEERARAADRQRQIRAACSAIYQNTVDKKIKDLTVREEQQVRTCQALGLYPPQ